MYGPLEFRNGLVNASFALTRGQWNDIRSAQSTGIYFRENETSPTFLGFDGMPFSGSESHLVALEQSCRF